MELIFLALGIGIGAGIGYFYQKWQNRNKTASKPQTMNWQQVVQQSPVGYLQVDEENHLFCCNHQARLLLELKSDIELINTEKKLLLQIVRSYELDQLIQETRDTNSAHQKEWIFHPIVDDPIHPITKADLPIKASSLPLEHGHVGIFIEDRQEAIILAHQRNRWAADVAHDFKTPLTSIRLIAESLQSQVEPSLQTWLTTIIKQTIRLSDLVQDILDLGQVDAVSSPKLNLELVDLPEIIQSAWSSLEPQITPKKIKLEYLGDAKIMITADRSKLYRLLLNLLDNSIKHSPQLQIILVKVEIINQTVALEIIDSGSGFAPEALERVFDRFYQSAQHHKGSGLGLAIARQIVNSHGGTISVANHPDTFGAWVRMVLPISQA